MPSQDYNIYNYFIGDFDNDNEVSISDAQHCLYIYTELLTGKKPPIVIEISQTSNITFNPDGDDGQRQMYCLDIDGDGNVTASDSLLITNYYVDNTVAEKNISYDVFLEPQVFYGLHYGYIKQDNDSNPIVGKFYALYNEETDTYISKQEVVEHNYYVNISIDDITDYEYYYCISVSGDTGTFAYTQSLVNVSTIVEAYIQEISGTPKTYKAFSDAEYHTQISPESGKNYIDIGTGGYGLFVMDTNNEGFIIKA